MNSVQKHIAGFRRSAELPVVAVIAASFGCAAFFLFQLATAEDRRLEAQTAQFVQRSINSQVDGITAIVKGFAAWGAAYRNLHVKLDTHWAYEQGNFGDASLGSLGLEYVFVLNAADSTVYALIDGKPVTTEARPTLGAGLETLVAQARSAPPNQTIPATAILSVGGTPVLVGAAAISTGGDPSIAPTAGPASILIFGDAFDAAHLAKMGSDWFVRNLRLGRDDDAAVEPNLPLISENGRSAYTLRWDPPQPGREMLQTILPLLLLAGIALAGLLVVLMRHAARSASVINAGVTRLADAHKEMKHLALHDTTTGLPNRASLAAFMADNLPPKVHRLAILSIDLDRFKPVNDSLGHGAGDFVLVEVGRRLRKLVREGDLVSRVGGDEFVVVLRDSVQSEIEKVCERLLRDLSMPIPFEGRDIVIGGSIGVAIAPNDATSTGELLRVADIALYQAKTDGRGTYRFFSPEMNERVALRRALESDMRRALLHEEFLVYYQPQFEANSMTIRSAEALVRWQHPKRGLITPSDFIPLAEATGLILPLGEWVLRTACMAAVGWQTISVSVNVSPLQVRSGDLVAMVRRVLAETGLPAARLELEITEGVLLEDTDVARRTLYGLKALGVTLAMDDFGTGYSSLGYLRTFPFDRIKIDKQFIANMEGEADSRAIIQSILGLGKALGMAVTAEGVETAGQLALLQDEACDDVQGFYTARPVSAEEFLARWGAGSDWPTKLQSRAVA